jgi:hypothetical protein
MGAAVDGGLWLGMRIWIVSGFVGYIESIRMVFQRSECSSYRCAVQRAYVHLPRFPWSPHMYLRCARSLRRVCVSHVGAVFACVPNAAPRGVLRFQRCSRRVRVQHQRKSGVR